ncbi:hypothetical protein K7432_001826 [Basidiobolus ranarum]|uniref:Uncharacterized protein n=1 Tax=Basidiobolus ranarum TaxID=34480 RepID=A0ABR2W8V7_9FUNG
MYTHHLSNHAQGGCSLRSTATIWIEMKEERLYVTGATNEALKLFGYMKESEMISAKIEEIFEVVEYLNESNDFLLLKSRRNVNGTIWINACAHRILNQQHWNLRDVTHQKHLTSMDLTTSINNVDDIHVLSITHFGVIEHVFPGPFMGFNSKQLVDRPLMMFVHPEDLKILCNGLSMMLKSMYANFTIRWQIGADESGEMRYQPIQVHAMISESSPICLIKRLPERSLSIRKTHDYEDKEWDTGWTQWRIISHVYQNCFGYIHDYLNYCNRYILGDSSDIKNWNRFIGTVYEDFEKSPLEAWGNYRKDAAQFLIKLVTNWGIFTSHK